MSVHPRPNSVSLASGCRKGGVVVFAVPKVKFTLQLRGRERLTPENHIHLLEKIRELLQDVAQAASAPQAQGPCSVLTLFMQPKKRQGRDGDKELHTRKQQQQMIQQSIPMQPPASDAHFLLPVTPYSPPDAS